MRIRDRLLFLLPLAFAASSATAGVYRTQLEVTKPAAVKPGQAFQIAAKLTGYFFVKWIQPQAPGQGAYIILYQGPTEIGRYRINEHNTQVTRVVSEPGPSGWNDLLGLGSETTARFNVIAPIGVPSQEYTVVYTGEKWSDSATSGAFNIRIGYPSAVGAIAPLLLDD